MHAPSRRRRGQIGKFSHIADHHDRGAFDGMRFDVLRQLPERRGERVLIGQACVADDHRRQIGRQAASQEFVADVRDTRHPHVNDEREPGCGHRAPIDGRAAAFFMAGDENAAGRDLAMRDRHPDGAGRCDAGGDAMHDLDGDALGFEMGFFLAAPAEHERVAALEPHHATARTRFVHHQTLDEGLRCRHATAALAHIDDARIGPRMREHIVMDQIIDKHHIGRGDRLRAFEREQFWVARPGADQDHTASCDGFHAANACAPVRKRANVRMIAST